LIGDALYQDIFSSGFYADKIWINIESGTNSKRTSEKRKINTQNKNNKNTKHKDYDIPLDGVVELKRRKIFGRFKDKIRV